MPIIQKVRSFSPALIIWFPVLFTGSHPSFQLSLTLLVHYRCISLFSLRVLVPRSSNLFMLYSRSRGLLLYGTRLPSLAFGFWLSPFFDFSWFARHYYMNLFWFLFLQLLRCFSSLSLLLGGFPLWSLALRILSEPPFDVLSTLSYTLVFLHITLFTSSISLRF